MLPRLEVSPDRVLRRQVPAQMKQRVTVVQALPDDEVNEDCPRALYGTDSPIACGGWPPVSPKAKRPRRTGPVVIQEMRLANFMDPQGLDQRLRDCTLFPSEDIYPVHAAAYFGDDAAMKFLLSCAALGADVMRRTSSGRTALDIAKDFNTVGSHDPFIAMLTQMQPLDAHSIARGLQQGAAL
eukprot:Skav231735  [mRNA]  locus=scaffold638:129912:132535:- [translate_table: standard]